MILIGLAAISLLLSILIFHRRKNKDGEFPLALLILTVTCIIIVNCFGIPMTTLTDF